MSRRCTGNGFLGGWPPPASTVVDRLQAWGFGWGAAFATTIAAWVAVPLEVLWWHRLTASLVGIEALALCLIAAKLINIVIRGRGRRRA